MSLSLILYIVGWTLLGLMLAAILFYVIARYYEARYDRTYMTQDERGFKRALAGKGVLWDYEESVVKGPSAPRVDYVALDTATGGRRTVPLLDANSGAINLRPQYCAPLPFNALTADAHKVVVEARVQFSLNRALLKHVYEIQDFGFALETRIHSAFRSEVGKRQDEELRASLHEVERAVIDHLRTAEREGDESGEPGMALGVNFHTASFTFTQADEFDMSAVAPVRTGGEALAPGQAPTRVRAGLQGQGVLSMRPQQIDQFADVFRNRDPAATKALLALLEMQTRQNIAESLAASGQLVVLTAQELGLFGAAAQRDAVARTSAESEARPPVANGGDHTERRV